MPDERPSGDLRAALAAGVASVSAWAEVLDRINVFPVADGDTGRNLVVSLAPLRDASSAAAVVGERLLLSARGNSGNIACAFVRSLLDGNSEESLASRCVRGAERARKAVANPQPGTMLTVLDALAVGGETGICPEGADALLVRLVEVVRETVSAQESLRRSNVVDSGALGMLVFLDGMLRRYFGLRAEREDIATSFQSLVRFERPRGHAEESGFCVDAVVRLPHGAAPSDDVLRSIGHEVIALRAGDLWKIHLHAEDVRVARDSLGRLGEVVRWSWDDLEEQISHSPAVAKAGEVHVVTDGAASLSRRDAEALGLTLLDSHVDFGDRSLPETRIDPEDLYATMRRGVRVSTSQASTFEREQHYQRLTSQWPSVLYLCVGSVYTGNHAVASAWQAAHSAGIRMTIVDSGAASGRLAVVARATALGAREGGSVGTLAAFAKAALERAEEYIFLERLEYLARGGRMSKAGAWFGDALHLAPVVSPFPDGARKVALLRKLDDKLAFACDRVRQAFSSSDGRGYLLVQFTDNRPWIEGEVLPRLRAAAPRAELAVGPLSLTTGAHTGPGTWAVAMLPAGAAHGT
jgi:uncharacterized protein